MKTAGPHIAVIGGGFNGLSAALHVAEAGVHTILLEAQAPGFGASDRNNGQVVPTYRFEISQRFRS